ncbi:MAG: kynureninase [Chloroflexi bacterium]|nr:kynureninase [Chloroflexota bacterium]
MTAFSEYVLSQYRLDADDARARDSADALRGLRDRFYLTAGQIYMDGNSLGPLSKDAESSVLAALQDWKEHAIEGWTAGERPWFWMGEALGALQAQLVGAEADEVVTTGAITTNLHQLLATFYRPTGRRTRIVADELDFPSDVYALQSHLRLHGYNPAEHLVLVRSRDGRTIDEDDVIAAMTDDVAVVWLPSVLYRTGQLLDLERLTRAAHARDILIGFDLAHSAGSVPHRLHAWGVDFGVWCTYKYLNGGPGAVGALYVHRRHFGTRPGLAGWWGGDKARQFEMSLAFSPASTAGAWQISTPSVLGAAALYGSLRMISEAGLEVLREKSLDLTGYLMFLVDELLTPLGFCVGTPREAERRGGHVAVEHAEALRISRALRVRGVVPDFRPPNVIRLAPVALYTTYTEIWETVQALREIVATGAYTQYEPSIDLVT